jgi:hypothetical protein
MERNGKRTHQGDLNREIQARNRVRGIPREIREAYYLSVDRKSFAAALEKKELVLGQITEADAAMKVAEWGIQDRYVPQYKPGEWVAVTERGHEYRLGPQTMGDSPHGITDFMKLQPGEHSLSLEAAQAEAKRRSRVPKVDRDAVIENLMRTSTVREVAIADLPAREQEQYSHEDRLFGSAAKTFTQAKDHPRTALPYGANMPNVRGDGEHVWWAYNSIENPEDLQRSLHGRGFVLARVTAEDAQRSDTQHQMSIRLGRYHPRLHEGEYLAVSDAGRIYQFNDRSLGHEQREIKAFMSKLDEQPMPSLREAQAAVQEKRQKEILANAKGPSMPDDLAGRGIASVRRRLRATERLVAPVFEFVSNGFESLFARTLSREEMTLNELTQHETKSAEKRAKRDRGEEDRER